MPLPAPNLDDRTFQQLVDEAKRRVQDKCPSWTDHNVSDPGVTLIETFAWMTDQVLYRLNRVPDRIYTTFLDLLGVPTYSAASARVEQTFWLSVAQPTDVTVPSGTQVSTTRELGRDPVVFTTERALLLPSVSRQHLRTTTGSGPGTERDEALARGLPVTCFSRVPAVGDALVVGLSAPVSDCAVLLHVECAEGGGTGVLPDDVPLRWEALTSGGKWLDCEVQSDGTRGLNVTGDVLLHVPSGHVMTRQGQHAAAWLRVVVVQTRKDQDAYRQSPVVLGMEAAVVGGTVSAVHAQRVRGEVLGESSGAPGQRFVLQRTPVVTGDVPLQVQSSADDGGREAATWKAVADFAGSSPTDPHVVLDARTGEVSFGPAVREEDGSVRQYGAVPPVGAVLWVEEYRAGGGTAGNVDAGSLVVLNSSLPYVSAVTNFLAATGGREAEDVEAAKLRGPVVLRHRGRAVTAEDYEHLAREAVDGLARVRAVSAGPRDEDVNGVRVLVVPEVTVPADGALGFEQLRPSEQLLTRVEKALDEVRVLGTRMVVQPPKYRGVTVVAAVRAHVGTTRGTVQDAARDALNLWFHPLVGGPDGTGWPFGRTVHVGEVYSVLQRVPGVDLVEEVRLYAADPKDGDRGVAGQRLDIGPDDLVFSYKHEVRVVTR